jgi:hypothetical protein
MGRAKPAAESAPLEQTTGDAPTTPTTADEREEILAAIEKLFAPLRVSQGRLESPRPAPVPPTAIASIARSSPTPLVTPEELAELRRLDREYTTAWSLANSLTPQAAGAAFVEQQAKAAAQARVGGHEAQDAWSRNDFVEDFRSRSLSAKNGAREAAIEAEPILQLIAARFRAYAEKAVGDELVLDWKRHRTYGVAFSASPLVAVLHGAVEAIDRHLPREGKVVRPAHCAAVFGIEL